MLFEDNYTLLKIIVYMLIYAHREIYYIYLHVITLLSCTTFVDSYIIVVYFTNSLEIYNHYPCENKLASS